MYKHATPAGLFADGWERLFFFQRCGGGIVQFIDNNLIFGSKFQCYFLKKGSQT